MIAPTCRNPDCPQKDIAKPYWEPPASPTVDTRFEPIDVSTIQWFCGACGTECETIEVDAADFQNPYEVI